MQGYGRYIPLEALRYPLYPSCHSLITKILIMTDSPLINNSFNSPIYSNPTTKHPPILLTAQHLDVHIE